MSAEYATSCKTSHQRLPQNTPLVPSFGTLPSQPRTVVTMYMFNSMGIDHQVFEEKDLHCKRKCLVRSRKKARKRASLWKLGLCREYTISTYIYIHPPATMVLKTRQQNTFYNAVPTTSDWDKPCGRLRLYFKPNSTARVWIWDMKAHLKKLQRQEEE